MNTVGFSNWLLSKGHNKKITSDIVSRLKRINKEILYSDLHTNIDEQYNLDLCKGLLNLLSRDKDNKNNVLRNTNLPINKPEISNYKTSLNKYLKYLESDI